jgi:hypothetical protein
VACNSRCTSGLCKQEPQVVLGEAAERGGVAAHSALEHQQLLLLQLQDALLDGAADDEAHDADGLELPQAMDAVLGLRVDAASKTYFVLFGMQSRTFGPYLAANNRILIRGASSIKKRAALWHAEQDIKNICRT